MAPAAAPDVVCLQELKATDASFPRGCHPGRRLRRRLAGTEDLERRRDPRARTPNADPDRDELPGDPADPQSRYIEAAVGGVLIACIYLPNGNPQPGPKFDYKLAWFERLIAHAAEFMPRACRRSSPATTTSSRPIWTSTRPSPGRTMRCCSRRAGRRSSACCNQGWTDAIRTLHPVGPDVHVLGLQAGSMAARRRPPPRPPPAEPAAAQAAWRRPGSTATSAARSAPAITRRPGSCSAEFRWPRRWAAAAKPRSSSTRRHRHRRPPSRRSIDSRLPRPSGW